VEQANPVDRSTALEALLARIEQCVDLADHMQCSIVAIRLSEARDQLLAEYMTVSLGVSEDVPIPPKVGPSTLQ
jgi:hypothetical protein